MQGTDATCYRQCSALLHVRVRYGTSVHILKTLKRKVNIFEGGITMPMQSQCNASTYKRKKT